MSFTGPDGSHTPLFATLPAIAVRLQSFITIIITMLHLHDWQIESKLKLHARFDLIDTPEVSDDGNLC